MATLIATLFMLFVLAAVGALLVWALSAFFQFLSTLLPEPSDTPSP